MEEFAEAVYGTMTGNLLPAFQVPGVENLFQEGNPYYENYSDMLDAYGRLCRRLGENDEDGDCETMIYGLMDNEHRLSIAMFLKGYEFGKYGCPPYLNIMFKGK